MARRRRREEVPTLWKKFMRGNLYLPILVVVYLIAVPFVARFVLHPASYSEQHQVVDRIKQETSEGDRIYIWDSHVQIYKESQRLAGSMFSSPLLYTNTEENKTSLINDLKEIQKQAENKIVPKYSEDYFLYLAKLVSEKYHRGQVDKAGVDYFKGHIEHVVLGVYSKKEKTVAYLHDIIEDTEITITDLNELEFPSDIVQAVELLTRIKNIDSSIDKKEKSIKDTKGSEIFEQTYLFNKHI